MPGLHATIDVTVFFTLNFHAEQMKLILALRRKMGEEDFYAIFDPRNRLIGDL